MSEKFPGRRLPVVAGMATMPTRITTFPTAFHSIVRQVDRLYLYLDGHDEIPNIVRGEPRVITILSRDVPGLRGNGKLFGLWLDQGPCLYASVDDDFQYPPDYIVKLRQGITAHEGQVAVGYLGSILPRPIERYMNHRIVFPCNRKLDTWFPVDVLGMGTAMFSSEALRFDVRNWPWTNMVDLSFAIEAAKAHIPLICLARGDDYLHELANNQPDSSFAALRRDDSRHTALARELLALLDGAD